VRKQRDGATQSVEPSQQPVRALDDLDQRFATGALIPENVPPRTGFPDIRG
jgi:hypothetical protein